MRTTINGMKAPCPLNRVNQIFKVDRPNQLWVWDFTYVSNWQGWLYLAFVIDVYARRIVVWFNHLRLLGPIGYIRPTEAAAKVLPATRQLSIYAEGLT